MKDKQATSLEALNGLLTERKRYEEWLAALETRRSNTSDAVYQKVRSDYEKRLKDVSDRLTSRAGELRAGIASLTAKLQDIAREELAQHEARQEAELRAAVGEYGAEEWQTVKQNSEKQLARVARDRTATETQLADLNRVYAMSTGNAPVSATAVPAAAAPASPAAARPDAPAPVAPRKAQKSSSAGWPSRDGEDETTRAPAGASGPSGGRGAAKDSNFEELASITQPGTATATKTPESNPAPASKSKATRGGLPDLRTEQHKTLKCPECGAMNYPTEWYCERCGGELATL